MFTGIIEYKTKAKKIKKEDKSMCLTLPIPKGWQVYEGESISIDGICSTVFRKTLEDFSVYYMEETLSKTNVSDIDSNHEFNLEQSLTLNKFIGGHLVSGHIDTIGEVILVNQRKDSTVIKIRFPKKFSRYLIYKGSVAVNGISLTIVNAGKNYFSIALIPYTLEKTNLGSSKKGDLVNLEFDLVAKYLEKLAKK